MPNIADEKAEYDERYPWQDGGHEWSQAWGSATEQWVTTIYRRIFHLLPTRSILEIAPGFGRWTPFLLNLCDVYIGVDIAERCIAHCRRTYGPLATRPTFQLGDGSTLAGITNSTISLAFSFDSLVHADAACLESYIAELARVLEPGGHAFLHHSNLGEYDVDDASSVMNLHRRDTSVSAELVAEFCRRVGLVPLVQEKTQWIGNDPDMNPFCDCFSLMIKPRPDMMPTPGDTSALPFYNRGFIAEIAECRAIGERYRGD